MDERFTGEIEFISPLPAADRVVEAIIEVARLDRHDDIKYELLRELCNLLAVLAVQARPPTLRASR
jgi:hypothetical protein